MLSNSLHRGESISNPENAKLWSKDRFREGFVHPETRKAGTLSAYCELAPYWAGKLGKKTLSARKVFRRYTFNFSMSPMPKAL